MFIWTVNKCQTHTKSTRRRALTGPHPSSTQLETEGLPRPKGRLAWQWCWQGRKRQCEGRRSWGSHTCPEGQEPQAAVGPAHPLCSSVSGQAPPAALREVERSGHLCSAKAESLELPRRPKWPGANNSSSAGFSIHWPTGSFCCLPHRSCALRFGAIFNNF